MARAILYDSQVPISLWPYIVKASAYIRNRCFNKRLQQTPLEAATGRRPNLAALHLFGAKCFAYAPVKRKLEPRATPSVFVGYDDNSPAYLLYRPLTGRVDKVRQVSFTNDLYYSTPASPDNPSSNSSSSGDGAAAANDVPDSPGDDGPADTHFSQRRYPVRERHAAKRYGCSDINDIDNVFYIQNLHVANTVISVPNNYLEALMSPEKDHWLRAMAEEVASLLANDTYKLVPPPPGIKPVGGRWIFSIKQDPSGNLIFKARWVAQGFSQKYGIDYEETFAPTAHMPSIRMVLQIAVHMGMLIHQMDVKNAYLNSDIDRPIFMVQPQGFIEDPNLICKLNKSLYGLKQSARNWNTTLNKFLKSQCLVPSLNDPCVYWRNNNEGILYIVVWVDDLIICASSENILNNFKSNMSERFNTKDMGVLTWFLGMQFTISDNQIAINQHLYTNNILTRFSMQDCIPRALPCPLDIYKQLKSATPKPLKDKTCYREIVGSLIYLMYCTRPDICFAVQILSQFMSEPLDIHMKLARGVLRYLKGTIYFDLKYKRCNMLKIVGYADSDYAASANRKSVSGSCFQMSPNSGLISWRSRKQKLTGDSTCETEYVALAEAAKTAAFMSSFVSELTQAPRQTVTVYSDNQSAIALSHNPSFSDKTRHIDVKHHIVRDYVNEKLIDVCYVPTTENIADIFTKPMTGDQLSKFACIRGSIPNVEGGDVKVHTVNLCDLSNCLCCRMVNI